MQSGRFPTGLSVSFTMLHMSWVLQVLLRYWWRPPLTAPDSPVQGVPCSRSSPTGTIFLCRSPSCVCCKIKMVLPHIYVQSWFYTGLYISFAANNFLLHRPYIVRFTIFTLLFVPSTKALLKSLATAFSTAEISFSNPLAKDANSFNERFRGLTLWSTPKKNKAELKDL